MKIVLLRSELGERWQSHSSDVIDAASLRVQTNLPKTLI
jgi:hypothetical protein